MSKTKRQLANDRRKIEQEKLIKKQHLEVFLSTDSDDEGEIL